MTSSQLLAPRIQLAGKIMIVISSDINIIRERNPNQKCIEMFQRARAGSQRMACRGPFGDRWAAKQPLGVEGSMMEDWEGWQVLHEAYAVQ